MANAEEFYKRGLEYVKQGNIDLALEETNQAIAINPKYWQAYQQRAGLLYSMGDYDSAISDSTKALEIEPRDGLSYGYRGCSYYMKEEDDKAKKDLLMALSIHPDLDFALETLQKIP